MSNLYVSRICSVMAALAVPFIGCACREELPRESFPPPQAPAAAAVQVPVAGSPDQAQEAPAAAAPAASATDGKEELPSRTRDLLDTSPIHRQLVIDQPANLYFYKDQLLLPPYRLVQTDYRLILEGANASVLKIDYPVEPKDCPETLLELPDYIHADSSWKEIESHISFPRELFNPIVRYYCCRFPAAEAAEKFADYLRGLPFVASARWSRDPKGEFNPAENQSLRVYTKAGDHRDFFTNWWDWSKLDELEQKGQGFFSPRVFGFPKEEILLAGSAGRLKLFKERIDSAWFLLSQMLQAGSVYLSNGQANVSTSFSFHSSPPQLEEIEAILQQKSSAQERTKKIMVVLKITFGKDAWPQQLVNFIQHYDSSAEIRKDLQKLIESTQ